MTTKPYEYIIQYQNGFDLDLAYPNQITHSYRVVFSTNDKGHGVTHIATSVNGVWDYDKDIPDSVLSTIRHYSKLYYKAEF